MFGLRRTRVFPLLGVRGAPAKFRIVQQQVRELAALLHQIQLGHPGNLAFKLGKRYAEQLAEHVPRIVEAQRLVKVAGQNKPLCG
jgi:hypothetical protein